jgi:hypothetical protein
MHVSDIVLTKLRLEESTPSIEIAISEAEQLIKNYCSLSYIPGELVFVWANMAVDIIKTQTAANEPVGSGMLQSVSMGDTSYSFDTSADKYRQELIINYRAQLNRYRKGLFGSA